MPSNTTEAGPAPVVTDEDAAVLAAHAHFVQGGWSTPDVERERLLADAARQDDPQAFIASTVAKFRAELVAAQATQPAAVTPEQVAATAPDESDVQATIDLADAAAAEAGQAIDDVALTLPIGKFRRYKELRERQAQSDAEAKAIKEEADKLEAELVDAFADAGVRNLNLDGKTVYLHRSVYARRCDGIGLEDVKAALRAAGAGDLVTETINANTLSAYVRELTEDDDAPGLPAPLVGVLEPGERFGVRINASGSRPKSKTHSK